jgi:hypothetical protein
MKITTDTDTCNDNNGNMEDKTIERTIVVEDSVNTNIANITDINNDNNKKHNRVLTQGDKLNLIKARKQTTTNLATCGGHISTNTENNQQRSSNRTKTANNTVKTTQPGTRTKQVNKAGSTGHKRDGSRPTTRSTSGARRPTSPANRSSSKNGRVKTGAVR